MKYTLEFYETETGSCPVADFLISLPAKARRKATTYFEVLEEGGPNLREPYTKHLRDGLYELRCQCGQDTMRFIFFYFENRIHCRNKQLQEEDEKDSSPGTSPSG